MSTSAGPVSRWGARCVMLVVFGAIWCFLQDRSFVTDQQFAPLRREVHERSSESQHRVLGDSSVNNLNLKKAKSMLEQVMSLIFRRYELDEEHGRQFFRSTNNLDKFSWDVIKYKMAKKMAMGNSNFLMIFGGSSVTAGHDSFYNQSYPYIFKSRMINIFEALGVELTVHNIALGANNCVPYIFCYESMGGHNPDFVNWEQSYNCGRDNGVFESAARIIAMSDNRPGIVYYSASGAWSPGGCPASTEKVPYCDEEWVPSVAGLNAWNVSMDAISAERDALFKFNEAKPSSARFSGAVSRDYKSVGMMGFNVWEQNPMCHFVNKNGKNDSCNGIDAAAGCTMKFMTEEAGRYGSLNGKGANWHPTRAFHMLRGEAIAWIFSLVLYETILMYEQDVRTMSKAELITEYSSKLSAMDTAVPSPKYCGSMHCNRKPQCFTDFQPHYTKNLTLSELVVGDTNWIYDAAELGEWSLTYGYLDAKPLYIAKSSENGEIHLKITLLSDHEVLWVCGQVANSLAQAVFYLDANRPDAVKGKYTPSGQRVLWTKKKYFGMECKELSELPVGTHVLSIANNGTKAIQISHLLTWLP